MTRLRLLPDLHFLDERGSIRSLRDYLGDFTVLAFTGCNGTEQRFLTKLLKTVVAKNGAVGQVKVIGINVHSSNGPNGWHAPVHRVDARKNLVTIDDADGTIRRWHGVGGEDEILLIGPDGRVIDSASVQDAARLLQELRIDVAASADGLRGVYPQESNA
jgi:hypothetical protein